MRIAVLTPTIPGREGMLRECRASVKAQTLRAKEHLVLLDDGRSCKAGRLLNDMAKTTACEWLAPFADDDLMLPGYLARLAAHTEEADIVYADCVVTGRDWSPNGPFDANTLHIPAAALIRRDLWRQVKGWGEETRAEDNAFWRKCHGVGARFLRVEEPLWVYRFHGHNKSLYPTHHDFWEAEDGGARTPRADGTACLRAPTSGAACARRGRCR